MKICKLVWVVASFVPLARAQAGTATPAKPDGTKLRLAEGWFLQSSSKIEASGAVLSTPSFQPHNWYEESGRTTVVAALVHHKLLSDPFFGMNLRQFPGITYPVGANFSNLAMDM